MNIWKFSVHILLKPSLENLQHYFASYEMSAVVGARLSKSLIQLSDDGWSFAPSLLVGCPELLIAKFRLKLKKVWGKKNNTRSFRYDLNQIPYDYIVEVTGGFQGLDLIDRVPEKLWIEVCNFIQEAMIKPSPKERQMRNGKMYPIECRVPENSKAR